jgi:hypothetical protein
MFKITFYSDQEEAKTHSICGICNGNFHEYDTHSM